VGVPAPVSYKASTLSPPTCSHKNTNGNYVAVHIAVSIAEAYVQMWPARFWVPVESVAAVAAWAAKLDSDVVPLEEGEELVDAADVLGDAASTASAGGVAAPSVATLPLAPGMRREVVVEVPFAKKFATFDAIASQVRRFARVFVLRHGCTAHDVQASHTFIREAANIPPLGTTRDVPV